MWLCDTLLTHSPADGQCSLQLCLIWFSFSKSLIIFPNNYLFLFLTSYSYSRTIILSFISLKILNRLIPMPFTPCSGSSGGKVWHLLGLLSLFHYLVFLRRFTIILPTSTESCARLGLGWPLVTWRLLLHGCQLSCLWYPPCSYWGVPCPGHCGHLLVLQLWPAPQKQYMQGGFLNGKGNLSLKLRPWLTPGSSQLLHFVFRRESHFQGSLRLKPLLDSIVWLCIFLVLKIHNLHYLGMFLE